MLRTRTSVRSPPFPGSGTPFGGAISRVCGRLRLRRPNRSCVWPRPRLTACDSAAEIHAAWACLFGRFEPSRHRAHTQSTPKSGLAGPYKEIVTTARPTHSSVAAHSQQAGISSSGESSLKPAGGALLLPQKIHPGLQGSIQNPMKPYKVASLTRLLRND